MKVSELFEAEKVSQDFLTEMADEGSYWESCHKFVIGNWTRDIDTLSAKQGSWLTRILEDCVEKRIEG